MPDHDVPSPIRILGHAASINVRKVLWTCEEAGLAYRREDRGGGSAPLDTPEFLAMNPHGLVPVIEIAGGYFWESNTICRCLAAMAGCAELLPVDPLSRARVECWMDWQATELNNAWRYAFMALVRKAPGFTSASEIAASVRVWNVRMQVLDAQLERTGAHVAGANFTLADVVVALSVNRWRMTPIERPDLPAIGAYFDRLRQRPAFRRHCGNGLP
jgi:glutathione S-transferase